MCDLSTYFNVEIIANNRNLNSDMNDYYQNLIIYFSDMTPKKGYFFVSQAVRGFRIRAEACEIPDFVLRTNQKSLDSATRGGGSASSAVARRLRSRTMIFLGSCP